MKLTIGSRGSKLALWQAEWIKAQLEGPATDIEISIEIIKTTGDELKTAPLAIIGGKGVFTKEIEEALLSRRIDLAVHSLKDLPTAIPDGLVLAAITRREDPRDALIARRDLATTASSIDGLPPNALVGTSSPRRRAQLKHLRPDLSLVELRGNVDTRLRKLDAGDYDAVILAAAGLKRLGAGDRISSFIPTDTMVPAVGQGALGIEAREGDHEILQLLRSLEDREARACCTAERALLRELGGGCQLPIAAHATISGQSLTLIGLVASADGKQIVRDQVKGPAADAEALGQELAAHLLERGAGELLSQ